MKILVFSKIYDTAMTNIAEIEAEVQKDLDECYGKDCVSFGLYISTNNNVSMVFVRHLEYSSKDIQDKLLHITDCYLLTGESYSDFRMPNPFSKAPYGYECMIEQEEFKKAYKESALSLGADKVKRMKLEVKSYSVVIRLRL